MKTVDHIIHAHHSAAEGNIIHRSIYKHTRNSIARGDRSQSYHYQNLNEEERGVCTNDSNTIQKSPFFNVSSLGKKKKEGIRKKRNMTPTTKRRKSEQ